MKTLHSLLAFILAILTAPAEAQTFSRTYRGPALGPATLDRIQEAPDGGLVALGRMDSERVVLSLDPHGNVKWCRTLDPGFIASGLAVSPVDGNVLVLGAFGGSGTRAAAMLLDQGVGALVWAKVYFVDVATLFSGVANDDGTFVACGAIYLIDQLDFWIVKIDSQGDLLWDRVVGDFDRSEDDVATHITRTRNGYAIVGSMQSNAGDPDTFLIQFNEDGGLIGSFFARDSFGRDRSHFVAELTSGDLVIASGNHLDTVIIACHSPNATLKWEVEFSNNGDFPEGLVATPDGGCVVACATDTSGGKGDALLIKLDSNGVPLWQKQYSAGLEEEPRAMVATADGGFVIAGTTDSFQGTADAWVLKVNDVGVTSPCCFLDRDVDYPPLDPTVQVLRPRVAILSDLGKPKDLIGADGHPIGAVEFVQCATNSGPWTDLGSGLAGSSGVPCYAGVGTLQGNSFVTSLLSGARPLSLAFLIIGFSELNADVKDGTLVPTPDLIFVLSTNLSGGVNLPGTWPPGLPSGFPLYLQYFIQDPAGPEGFSISNAIRAITP